MDQSEKYKISDPPINTNSQPQSQKGTQSPDLTGWTRDKLFDSDANLPRKFFITTIIAIFIAEVLAMIVIYNIDSLPYWQETLLDAMIMVVFIFPVVYFLLFRPLLLQISERKRGEAILERFFLSINTLIAYMDRDFNFIRVNDSYARSAGHSPEFMIGKNHFELYPHPENEAIFRRVAETGEPYSVFEKPFEYAEYPERGVTYWDWSLQPVKTADGEVEGLVLSLVDVSERKHAEEKLEQQNKELLELSHAEARQRELAESLMHTTLILNTSLEFERVLFSVLEQIRKAIPYDGAAIMLREGEILRLASFLGFENQPEYIPTIGAIYRLNEYPLLQQVCETMLPVNIEYLREQTNIQLTAEIEWVSSYLAAPLVIGEKVIGIINLASDTPGAFSQKSSDRLQAFAAPAALALHNARLFQAESTARQVAETLGAAAQALGQALDLEQVVETLLNHIQMIVKFDTAGVTLLEDETRLAIRTMRGYGQWADLENIPSFPINGITDSVIHRMISARRSIAIPNISLDSAHNGQSEPGPIRTWLLVPIIANDKVIGLLELGRAREEDFNTEQIHWAEALVGQAAVAIQNAWLFQQVQLSSDRLQSLARKLVEIQENERAHIARELHDEAGQVLSSLKLNLGRLEQDPECPPHFHQRLQELKGTTDSVLEELHRLAMDLRPAALDHLGLVPALEQYAKNLTNDELSIQIKSLGFGAEDLSQEVKTSIYRIVQEALTNIVRHSQASSVGILLEQIDDRIKVFVEDDGIGFNIDLLEQPDHLGLVGMRERAEMLGGNLTVESLPGYGTSIIVEVPDGNPDSDRR